jgi:hypothetical protein
MPLEFPKSLPDDTLTVVFSFLNAPTLVHSLRPLSHFTSSVCPPLSTTSIQVNLLLSPPSPIRRDPAVTRSSLLPLLPLTSASIRKLLWDAHSLTISVSLSASRWTELDLYMCGVNFARRDMIMEEIHNDAERVGIKHMREVLGLPRDEEEEEEEKRGGRK